MTRKVRRTAKINTLSKTIENEIYRVFKSFGNSNSIDLIAFFERFDINTIMPEKHSIKFSNHSLIRAICLMKIKCWKQTQLYRYLKDNENVALHLGFFKDENNQIDIPNYRTINYFLHKIDDNTKNLIEFFANRIKSIAERAGLSFDDGEILKANKIEKPGDKHQLQHKIEKKKEELYQLAKRILTPSVKFDYMRPNCKYGMDKYLQLLFYLSLGKRFAESGSELLSKELKDRGLKKAPNGESFLYHIKKWDDIESLQRIYDETFNIIFKFAKKKTNFFSNKKVDIAIDHTTIWYFGDPNDTMVVNRMGKMDGTPWGFRFIVISIVNRGRKYILNIRPMGKFSNEHRIVKEMLQDVKKKVNINVLVADRYFSKSSAFIRLFEDLDIDYVMIANRTNRIKELIKITPSLPYHISDYQYILGDSIKTNLVLIQGRKERTVPMITNLKLTDENLDFLAHVLDELYRGRWSIETTFRDLKQFLARTTSRGKKGYIIRLFYFLFAAILYNLWILGESLLSLFRYGRVLREKTSIKALVFVHGLFSLFYPP